MKFPIPKDQMQSLWRETKWIYTYARKYWLAIILYTGLGMVTTLISLGTGLLSKDMVDIITGHQTGLLLRTFCIFIGVQVFNVILGQVTQYASGWINLRVSNEVKADIFDRILRTDWEHVSAYHTGDLLARWGSDTNSIANGILSWLPNLFINLFRFFATLLMVLHYDPSFVIFSFLGFPISMLFSRTVLTRMRRFNEQSAKMSAKMSGFNQETFSNIQTIKAFDLLDSYGRRLRQFQADFLSMRLKYQRVSAVTSFILSFVGLAVSYSCYGWGIYRVWSGAISYGTMTMFLGLSSSLTGTLNSLVSLVPSAVSIGTSAGRIMEIMDLPKEDTSQSEVATEFLERHRSDGISVVLDQVTYAYRNGTQVFQDASFEAHAKEIVALVGPSGEGKTTMLRLILSLIFPQNGESYVSTPQVDAITGTERLTLSPSTRKFFSYVPQGNTMFSGTIAENMRNIRPDVTDEEIIAVLRTVCAWEFVEKLPDGIDSAIGERGGGFSEGQSQRLSIARALLCEAPILLLDEATSALDVATERRLLRNIMSQAEPRTCIVTTHRPTVLSACDRVYAIRNKQCILMIHEEIEHFSDDF
ncbi:MAG: ABC transporter ATP-binding protein/permease [Clostridium sp.]|jgi:ABC-type multidrug transport system fused ATPase/permease subunit|nr:ABC transporter ATP-binding protein/permease [Clostridium sp.]